MKEWLFAVSTDSTSDIRPSYAKERAIYLTPLTFTLEKDGVMEEYFDNYDSDEEIVAFYNKVSDGWFPRTAKLNYEAHMQHFRALGEAGVKVAVHFMISSGLANTVEITRQAAQDIKAEYPDLTIYPVDPLTATVGQGMLVRLAADCRDRGMTAEETVEYLNQAKNHIQHCIIPNDLFYLKKGGRVSTLSAAFGTMLNIKPMIVFDEEGKLLVKEKNKGMKKSFHRVIEHMQAAPITTEGYVFVVHTNNEAGANELAEMLRSTFGVNPQVCIMGPVIGSHVGPSSVSCCWLSEITRAELHEKLYR